MVKYSFHMLGNAHLDPVWLWDWREGMNEGISTSRSILDLMDADPDVTFIRGEAAIYEFIERHDKATFERIRRYVKAGRWDVVGGTYVQPDTNMPATETFARHFCIAKNYFLSRFGKRVRVAWAADSFGHSAGLPTIMAAAGIQGFAFTRPSSTDLPIAKPAFWWEGADGSRVLTYRPALSCYASERNSFTWLLDHVLNSADKSGLENIGVFYGLGNHGGGPSRRMLREIREWASKHPEIKIVHSGLHRYLDALREEGERNGKDHIPVHKGELNFAQRGCYSSVAKFKFAYRRLEAGLTRAERIVAATQAALGARPEADTAMASAWKAVLFNSFHDILPGSSIERAYDEQLDWVGGAAHAARELETNALNALATRIDTCVPKPPEDHPCAVPFLVFNPHPYEYRGALELEASLDFRPLWKYTRKVNEVPMEVRGADGQCLPFQEIESDNENTFPAIACRKRVLTPVTLPPLGWNVISLGWVEGAKQPKRHGVPAVAGKEGEISNGLYRVAARKGTAGIRVFYKGRPVFQGVGLSAVTVKDIWGAWGSEEDLPEARDLSDVLYNWKVKDVRTVESGPERATLWVLLTGGHSKLELTIGLVSGRPAVDIAARVHWSERIARLKLVMPVGAKTAECEIPGGAISRKPVGEMPGGRWVRAKGEKSFFGFASDALYNFDLKNGMLRATIVRATQYSKTSCAGLGDPNKGRWQPPPWRPVMDQGELRFRFILTPGDSALDRLACELEQPPVAMTVPARKGDWPRSGSLAELAPNNLRILALKPAEDSKGWVIRAQETAGRSADARLTWQGKKLRLGRIAPWRIATFKLVRTGKSWKTMPVDIVER